MYINMLLFIKMTNSNVDILDKFLEVNYKKYGAHSFSAGYLAAMLRTCLQDLSLDRQNFYINFFLEHIDKTEKEFLIDILKNKVD